MNQGAPRYLHSLDVARGIAAFAVVLWHWQHFFYDGDAVSAAFVRERQPLHALLGAFYDRGDQAVALFFTLSGFIFFWLYAGRISSEAMRLREFFVLRISRLYPLHLATLLFVACAQYAFRRVTGAAFVYPTNDAAHFILSGLFLSSIGGESGFSFNGPSWSVSVEMVLYAIFFLYCAVSRARVATMVLMVALGIGLLGAYKPTIGHAVGSFFLGGIMFAAYMSIRARRARFMLARAIPVVTLGVWILTSFAPNVLAVASGARALRLDSESFVTFALFPLTILSLALLEMESETFFRRLAEFTRLGDLSYSVYLLHFPLQLAVMLVLIRLGVSREVLYTPAALLSFLALLIAISIASHDRLEIPMQRLLRRRFLTNDSLSPPRSDAS